MNHAPRRGTVLQHSVLCGGGNRAYHLQIDSGRVLVGGRHHDDRGLWRHEVPSTELVPFFLLILISTSVLVCPLNVFFAAAAVRGGGADGDGGRGGRTTSRCSSLISLSHSLTLRSSSPGCPKPRVASRCGVVCRCRAVLVGRVLRRGRQREFLLQVHPGRVLVGRRHHDDRGLRRHDV